MCLYISLSVRSGQFRLLAFSLFHQYVDLIVLFLVESFIKERQIGACSLHIFFNFVPEILVFEKSIPLAMLVDTKRVIRDLFERCFFLFFSLDRWLDDEFLLPELIGILGLVQMSVPLSSISR
jgi:hypothetical protein